LVIYLKRSDKTTFLKQLAIRVATGQHADKRFPTLLPLSAYASAFAEQNLSFTIVALKGQSAAMNHT